MNSHDKLKIILLNIRYFIAGGSDRYMFNIQKLFEARGHEVIVFSVDFEENLPSPYSGYFVEPPAHRSQAYYNELELSLSERVRFSLNTIYSRIAKRKIKKLIADTLPDVAYVVAVQNYLSPSVLDGCREMGLPIVHRISDFGIICSRYTFNRDGKVCEKCYNSYFNAIRYSCGGHDVSRGKAVIRVMGILLWNYAGIYNRSVNRFVTPSRFMKNKLIQAGYKPGKITHIPTFVTNHSSDDKSFSYSGKHLLYFGRISPEKGILTLINAYAQLHNSEIGLFIAGSAPTGYDKVLKDHISKNNIPGVEFVGHLDRNNLQKLILQCLFTIVPSTWYENMPNAILESFAAGKPVVSSRIGSITELVEDGVDGLLFEPGNAKDLHIKMSHLLGNTQIIEEMGERGRLKVFQHNTPEQHYHKLMRVFNAVLDHDRLQVSEYHKGRQ